MLRALLRLPPVYRLAAFIAARRVLVRGWSMYPTLAPGERVLFDTLAYRLERPQRGDVVLATHPGDPTTKLVKRVTAVPSDRVTVRGDDWRVEGAPDRTGSASEGSDAAEARTWTLGPDEYFLVGDAADLSTDARHFGPTRRRDIRGRAWLVYWPPARLRAVRGREAR